MFVSGACLFHLDSNLVCMSCRNHAVCLLQIAHGKQLAFVGLLFFVLCDSGPGKHIPLDS